MSIFYVTVSAVEQLQVMASKRQYKEAAAQVEVLMVVKTLIVSTRKETYYSLCILCVKVTI